MGFSGLCGTCGAFGRMREYMGPELDQITHTHVRKSQTEHTILTERQVQTRIRGMLLVRILVKEPVI